MACCHFKLGFPYESLAEAALAGARLQNRPATVRLSIRCRHACAPSFPQHTDKHKHVQLDRETNGQTNRQTDGQKTASQPERDRQTDTQIDTHKQTRTRTRVHTYKHGHTHTHTHIQTRTHTHTDTCKFTQCTLTNTQ